ncbi:MAG: hypothetical protein M3022_01885 [Actinomycetota bacterium]|nr:hypothetical protein [Actinomycetota bacterium]
MSDGAADFVSGDNGLVIGPRLTSRALARDAVDDAHRLLTAEPLRLARAAAQGPRRRVLVLAVEREAAPNLLAGARTEVLRSRHAVSFHQIGVGTAGKFENLDRLLEAHPAAGHDWLLVIDDDVVLPPGFLDRFLFLAERFGLRLAQPAHRARSHAAWTVTRRRRASVARETAYVEIGPVSAFHADTFSTLLPFPPLRAGWGLDAHWAAVAAQRGWPLGVIDATAIRHGLRQIAVAYDRGAAVAEGQTYLAGRPYLRAEEANRTLRVHRSWR